jgi:drug/metabolite transporter (DMT)-like permease
VKDRQRGILLAFGGMLAISTDSLFTRVADAGGFDVVFWVGVLTAITMLGAVTLVQHRSPAQQLREDGRPLVAAAALQAGATIFFVLAVKNTSIANGVVIIAAAPLATAVISRIWIGERTSPRVWKAIIAAGMGIAVVMSGSVGGGRLEGDLLAVGAILCYGTGIVLLRGRPGVSRTMVIGVGGVIMALVAVVPATLFGHDLETWLAMFAMGAVFGPLARVMLASSLRYLPAAEVALFAPVETVLGILWAFIFFSEGPSALTIAGGVIVLGGLLYGIWPRREQRVDPAPAAATEP